MTYWKDSLLTGVSIIDTEHKKLIAAIDELVDECKRGQGNAAIGKTLSFVVSYTKKHFADEEKLQAQYAYPGITAHKQLHANFIKSITALKDGFDKNGADSALTGKINTTLVDWLIEHIGKEDRKLGEYIKSKGGN